MSAQQQERTAILLDHQALWLEAIELVLAKANVVTVAKTTSSSTALALVEAERPDLFITGLRMTEGEVDGLACVRAAREKAPETKVIVVSAVEDPRTIEAALASGASAYVTKSAHPDDFASAVRQSFSHSIYLANGNGSTNLDGAEAGGGPGLTRREREILQLLADGHSNAELARMLWVTEQTVKFHLSNIYRKLGVSNRTEASRWAQIHGLLATTELTAA